MSSPPTEIKNLEELIKGRINGEVVEQVIQPLVEAGENYGSVVCKADFKVKNGEKVQTYHGVAKFTPPNKIIREVMNIQQTFTAEIAWYQTIVPTIKSFQQECGVEQVADFFQTFYGGRLNLAPNSDVVDDDAIVLTENLIPLGFKNIDRHVGFDLKTSKAVLRDLATFHAVPLAIKLKNKGLFNKNIKANFPNLKKKDDGPENGEHIFDGFIKLFAEMPELSPYSDRIDTCIKNTKLNPSDLVINELWGSICHRDFWINNIMIKEGEDIKTMLLDFQLFQYDSIAVDVLFLLTISVALGVIEEHMDELIKYYWDEFLKNLQQLNVDTSLFTFEGFLKEIDHVASQGLFGRSLYHVYLILLDKGRSLLDDSDTNSNNNEEVKQSFEQKFNERHMEKYKWLVLEYIKRGWM